MIISSERKFDSCPKCNGAGSIKVHGTFPWSVDESEMCGNCMGSGKIETKKYNFDKNIYNIDNIVTVGEIEIAPMYIFDRLTGHIAKFYINGHIETSKYEDRYGKSDEEIKKTKEIVYIKIKKIRDELIEKLKEKSNDK